MTQATIGVIGGSGLYEIEGFTDIEEHDISTPFGKPSDPIVVGTLQDKCVAFLPRHGRGHRILPGEVNVRANIYALKSLGVERIIAVNACGSMKEEIAPSDIVIPDQIIDRTKGRVNTFFGNGLVVHVSFAEPFCAELSEVLFEAAKAVGAKVHKGGTYVCIEGPRFSSKAESKMHRLWDVDIIGMTAIPEAVLAREAEICYASLALSTDYDVWHETEAPVTAEMVVQTILKNVETAKKTITEVVPLVPSERGCDCATALSVAIQTAKDRIPGRVKQELNLLVGKYLD
ncbi:MAG: S-methyl-5'-thioadenosine phosphorylase [Chloroflexi bacterium B3_Chlor]|nr:MAG: S-methyl-5'-thioadenosine phosphorylase [Chloroflexi bacterium B3_Chlor]